MSLGLKKLLLGFFSIVLFFAYAIGLRLIPNKTNRFQDAIEKGRIDMIANMLTENPALANKESVCNFTPLQIASSKCNKKHTKLVGLLIEHGADVDKKGGRHKSPP